MIVSSLGQALAGSFCVFLAVAGAFSVIASMFRRSVSDF